MNLELRLMVIHYACKPEQDYFKAISLHNIISYEKVDNNYFFKHEEGYETMLPTENTTLQWYYKSKKK